MATLTNITRGEGNMMGDTGRASHRRWGRNWVEDRGKWTTGGKNCEDDFWAMKWTKNVGERGTNCRSFEEHFLDRLMGYKNTHKCFDIQKREMIHFMFTKSENTVKNTLGKHLQGLA
jgi:hypothetical protein